MSSPAIALALALACCGCGGPPKKSYAPSNPDREAILDLTDPAKPLPPERFAQAPVAYIIPGDELELRILGFPELSGAFKVAQDGRINLSLIGSVQAAGKSAEELDRDLTTALGTYYRNLDVAVNVRIPMERDVYVLGEVSKPGRYNFRTGERVIHAVADAGGMTEKAREDGIILLRREEDGRDHAYRLDFSEVHAKIAPRDIVLQPGDVVFVPKSRFQTLYDFMSPALEMVGRAATSALVIDDLRSRTRSLNVGQ
jgi:polysaccharide export outer membrane protein